MNGAELLCDILEKFGVEYVFGLFGDIQTDFAHAVVKSKIKWIGVHNEKSGGFMADIYARVAKKPGVFFSTLGPGGTNLTSALTNATQDRSPLVTISDQVPLDQFHLETHQFVDFAKAFQPTTGISKFTAVVKNVGEMVKVLSDAFSVATCEPMGAVHVSIPVNLLGEKVVKHPKIKQYRNFSTVKVSKENTISYEELVKRLRTKKPGIVIVGGIIERADAREEFRLFIEKFNLPVFTSFRGKNALPSNHPQCLGTISRHLGDVIKEVISKVDFILTIGYEYNEGVKPSIWKGKEQSVLNINSYDNRIDKIFYPPSLFGDVKDILRRLSQEQSTNINTQFNFGKIKNKIKTIINEALDVDNRKLHPKRIIAAVNKLYSTDSIIICDVGLNKYYSGLLLDATDDNRILFTNGQSAMAFSSGAMGAKIADPKKNVVVLVGDGGFLMNPQEVLTTVEYHKQIIWIIFNNGGLGLTEQAQRKHGPNPHGVHFSKVFFTRLAEAFGLEGVRIDPGRNLYLILEELKNSGKSAIIDVPVVYTPLRKSYRDQS